MDATTIGIAVAVMAGILLALVLGRAVLQTLRNAAWIIAVLLSLAVILLLAGSVFQAQTTALIAVTSQTLSMVIIGLLTLLLLGASGALLYLIFHQRNQQDQLGNVDLHIARLLAANLTLLTELTLKNRRPALPDPDDETALSYDYEDDEDTDLPILPQGWGW